MLQKLNRMKNLFELACLSKHHINVRFKPPLKMWHLGLIRLLLKIIFISLVYSTDSAEGHEKETAKDVALEDLNPFHDNENNSADMKQHSEEHISYQQNSNIASFEQPDQTENEPESCITKEQSEFSTKSFEEDPNPFENEVSMTICRVSLIEQLFQSIG